MIRYAVPDDKQTFISMGREFYSSSAVISPINPQSFEDTFTAAMNESPFVRVLMIENGEKPIGYALLSLTYSNEAGGMVVLIEEVQVDEPYRGGGYGSELFRFIEREFPTAKRFRLEVCASNTKAIELYGRLGYKALDYLQMVKDV